MSKLILRVQGDDALTSDLPASGMLVIGSSPERAGFLVDGQGVDDAHCAIGSVKGGGWAIKDLGSRYGTMVNGKKITSKRIAAGDTILIGSRRIAVVDPEQPAALEEEQAPTPTTTPEPAPAPAPASAPQQPAPQQSSARAQVGVPKRVGGYRVDRLLGRGGMGTVLLAEQESLHRPVALKLLPPRLAADAVFVAQFQKEARAAAALNHPNVVVVHDVGEADGFHFLSMEYMEKGSLEDRIKREGPLPWREVLDVLHDAARGLMFAEEKDIIHRDIKPGNLMQNAAGTIKISDLGLATSVDTEVTDSGGKKIFGTPHFIAPEQARGGAIDHRADLYSLGATAFQLLTGRTPFEGETTRDILRGHLTEDPPSPRSLVSSIPEGLDALVLRSLAKEPADRHQSAEFLLAEVDRLRLEADHGVGVRPGGSTKKGLPVGLLAGIGVLVLIGVGAVMFLGGGSNANGDGGGDDPLANGANPTNGTGSGGNGGDPDESIFAAPSGTGDGDAGEDLEAELRERNLLAENAYLRIDPTLSKVDRIDVLEGLAEKYAGTDTADKTRTEISTLNAEVSAAAAAALEVNALLSSAEKALRVLCSLPTPQGELPRPGDQLRQATAFTPPVGLDAAAAAGLVSSIEDKIVSAADTAFRAVLKRTDALATEGRFQEIEPLLSDLLPRLDLPEYPAGKAPKGYDELALIGGDVRGRLNRLAGDAERWDTHRRQADRETMAAALRGSGEARRALSELDLEGAITALATLEGSVATDEARSLAQSLKRDAEAGQAFLTTLASEFTNGGWRRRSVSDPRGGRGTARDVVGADATGLQVDVRGTAEPVPWTAFGGQTDALGTLVKDRLSRDYTPEEKDGIAGLMRISAALEAAGLADQMLDPSGEAHFSDAEATRLTKLFDPVEPWIGDVVAFAREREAADVLARALLDLEASMWSSAEAGLATLLTNFDDTLLVASLSDGSLWQDEGE